MSTKIMRVAFQSGFVVEFATFVVSLSLPQTMSAKGSVSYTHLTLPTILLV